MCKETSSREATSCPGCGVTFSFLPFHAPHCQQLSANHNLAAAAIKRDREAATANNRNAKRRSH